ncbi:MAG TPA: DedA family protein [Parachlamydiaceae bacterium]|nr:DedA family protein [Parachlamydiaceae bacterium]
MDCLNETFAHFLMEYGSIGLFLLLVLGIIALPIPEETLLVFSGALVAQGVLNLNSTILAAVTGSLCGITISYLLGLTGGTYLVQKYGKWFGLTTKRLEQANDWFHHYGKWSLFIGYFIPGIRHFTGFTAGTAAVEYRHFALYAYTGAIVWIATFLSIGYLFGDVCFSFLEKIDMNIVMMIGAALVLAAGYYFWKRRQQK